MVSRKIELPSLINTRSLEGMVNRNGKTIKPNNLIRSAKLCDGSREDLISLYTDYNLRTIVDFRNKVEAAFEPDPIIENQKYILNVIMPQRVEGITHEKNEEELDKSYESVKSPLEAKIHMGRFYRFMGINGYCQKMYKEFLHILLENENGSVLWHCSLGKDRCGIATALILAVLDFDKEAIIEDYLYTNENLYPGQVSKDDKFCYNNWAYRDYIESFFDAIDQDYDSIDNYLEKVMGIDKEKRNQFREKYLQ